MKKKCCLLLRIFSKSKKCHQNWNITKFRIFAIIEKDIYVLTLLTIPPICRVAPMTSPRPGSGFEAATAGRGGGGGIPAPGVGDNVGPISK
jgi:hypothetical protein